MTSATNQAKNIYMRCQQLMGEDLNEVERLHLIQLLKFAENFLFPNQRTVNKKPIPMTYLLDNLRKYAVLNGFSIDDETGKIKSREMPKEYGYLQKFYKDIKEKKTFSVKKVSFDKKYKKQLEPSMQLQYALHFFKKNRTDDYEVFKRFLMPLHNNHYPLYFMKEEPGIVSEKLNSPFVPFPLVKIQDTKNVTSMVTLIHEMQHQVDDCYCLKKIHVLREVSSLYTELLALDYFSSDEYFYHDVAKKRQTRNDEMKTIVNQLKHYDGLLQMVLKHNVALTISSFEQFLLEHDKAMSTWGSIRGFAMTDMYNYLFSYIIAYYYKEKGKNNREETTEWIKAIYFGYYKSDFSGLDKMRPKDEKFTYSLYKKLPLQTIIEEFPHL